MTETKRKQFPIEDHKTKTIHVLFANEDNIFCKVCNGSCTLTERLEKIHEFEPLYRIITGTQSKKERIGSFLRRHNFTIFIIGVSIFWTYTITTFFSGGFN